MFAPKAPSKNWGDMYFHQKLTHLIDHAADFLVDYSKFWVPCVGAAMGVSIMLFGGENGVGDLLSVATPVILPSSQQSSFGQVMPGRPPQEEEGLDEDSL